MNARRAGDCGWLLEVDDPARVAAALRRAFPHLEEVVPGQMSGCNRVSISMPSPVVWRHNNNVSRRMSLVLTVCGRIS